MRKLTVEDKRVCAVCGLDKTYIRNTGQPIWFTNKPTNLFICAKCHKKYFWIRKQPQIKTKESIRLTNQKQILFRHKHTRVGYNPRIGICSWCNRKIGDVYVNSAGKKTTLKQTAMHHVEYHDDDPLKDTIELCNPCHGRHTLMSRLQRN